MAKTNVQLPYFDALLEYLRQGDPDTLLAFGRHVHWGCWEEPAKADGSVADFAAASERLCRRVCDAGGVRDGARILDAGCGFGGTIASLNERFSDLDLVGLNIDPRQLERARQEVRPRGFNQINFVEGDACQLPFEDASFDAVLAVECIFHFPSRDRFFQEVRRVLRPGGKLALSDFVPVQMAKPVLQFLDYFVQDSVARTYGDINFRHTLSDYRHLAKTTGFVMQPVDDITINTLPTYPVVRKLALQMGFKTWETNSVHGGLELLTRLGVIRYPILAFEAS
jgi:ubiquinone/menaquinone biosynthesis C-methylase UbiE